MFSASATAPTVFPYLWSNGMNGYCLRKRKAPGGASGGCAAGAARRRPFLLTADGELRPLELRPLELRPFSPPELGEGEGLLLYGGEFRVEPLEIQIEFMKAGKRGEMAGGAGPAPCGTGAGRGAGALGAGCDEGRYTNESGTNLLRFVFRKRSLGNSARTADFMKRRSSPIWPCPWERF